MYNTEVFIKKAKKVHGDKYDYSKIDYNGCYEKVCIICPEHGEFWQTPSSHLYGCGCRKCGTKNMSKKCSKKKEEFLELAKKIHNDKYDYSKVEYVNSKTKVCIICPEHGEFWQTPDNHLSGHGCQKCKIEKVTNLTRMPKDEFIKKSKQIHGNKYDYSKVEYKNCDTPVLIICPVHGEFWQKPYYHIHKGGCPHCKESKLEKNMCKILTENNINFERQKKFTWLRKQRLDFYLPDYNIAIECQGRQHFEVVNYFGGKKEFEYRKALDEIKKKLCDENNVRIIYYSDKKWNDEIVTDENYILKKIGKV